MGIGADRLMFRDPKRGSDESKDSVFPARSDVGTSKISHSVNDLLIV